VMLYLGDFNRKDIIYLVYVLVVENDDDVVVVRVLSNSVAVFGRGFAGKSHRGIFCAERSMASIGCISMGILNKHMGEGLLRFTK
jgi:hypothetical protein